MRFILEPFVESLITISDEEEDLASNEMEVVAKKETSTVEVILDP